MLFFITDKGRKFFKAFREAMITGKFRTTNGKIPDSIRYPFWLLNKMITAALIGSKDPVRFWSDMNTNDVISEIHRKIGKKYSGTKMVNIIKSLNQEMQKSYCYVLRHYQLF